MIGIAGRIAKKATPNTTPIIEITKNKFSFQFIGVLIIFLQSFYHFSYPKFVISRVSFLRRSTLFSSTDNVTTASARS